MDILGQDISPEVKAWSQMGLSKWTMTLSIFKMFLEKQPRDDEVKIENQLMGRIKRCEPTNLTSILYGRMNHNSVGRLNNLKALLSNACTVYVNLSVSLR